MNKKDEKPKGFWKQLMPYAKSYKKQIVITVLCSMVVGICVAIQPLMIKNIVDDGISNTALSNPDKLRYVGFICILYIVLAVGRISFWRVALKNMLKALEGSLFNLRSHFFSHIENMCMKFYDSTSVGELFNCIMGTPMNNIKTYMNQMLITVPYQIISFVISIVALVSYDPILTVILVATALVMATLNYFSRKKIKKISSEYLVSEAEASKYINDVLNGMDAIKLYSVEETIFSSFQEFISTMYKTGVKASLSQAIENFKPEFTQYVGTALVYFIGAASCIYRGVSVGVLYAFLSCMGSILGTFYSWLGLGLQRSSAEAGMDKIIDVINTYTSTPEIENPRSIAVEKESATKAEKPCIEFKNVDFAYNNTNIFSNFSCKIPYNQSIALVGGSGSGKSTFSKLIMRLYDIQNGEIRLHGRNVKSYSIHDLRTSFGVVPQSPFIFQGSIWDNVRIAAPNATNKEIIRAMETAHAHEFINELPNGWNTVVGDGGLDLSGGQKQRIAIARAVLGNPDILIFDEATSALDNISEKHIQAAMEDLMKTHTVIIIAHRLSTIRNVDRVLVFDKGKIIEDGGYNELIEKGEAFATLLSFSE